MNYINKISNEAHQRLFLTGNPGQRIVAELRYLASQQLWMIDLEYGAWFSKGLILTTGPNILRNYRDIIPFGITCDTLDGQDPYSVDDFSSQYANLYLLNQEDVLEIERGLFE